MPLGSFGQPGAKGLAALVDEVGEPRPILAGKAAETEALEAEGKDLEVAQTAVLLQGDGIEADEVAAAGAGLEDPFVVVDQVAAAVEDEFALVDFGRERVVRGVTVDDIGGPGSDQIVGDAAVAG